MTLKQRRKAAARRLRNAVRKLKNLRDRFPGNRRKAEKAKTKRKVTRRQHVLTEIKRALDRKRRRLNWPERGSFSEILYHAPPHLHIASADRNFLIRICRIAEEHYGLRVGEFPPFDLLEPVHVNGSWHYRDSSNPWVPRNYSNRGDGLAADLNNEREYEFYLEVLSRYG